MKPDVPKMVADAKALQAKMAVRRSVGGWYEITNNADDDSATIRIYDEIGFFGVEADAFSSDLSAITASRITVAINSPGGSVMDGLAIYNSLRVHPAHVTTRVDGIAASAASFIAQAGDERIMVESSQMMIHDASGVFAGSAADFREVADFLERQSANIAELYASRSGQPVQQYVDMMAAETWMTAAEAVENGLADSVLVPERKTSNTSPQAATDSAAAMAAADVAAALVESKQDGGRAAFLRSLKLSRRN